jgi:hypothetical protein
MAAGKILAAPPGNPSHALSAEASDFNTVLLGERARLSVRPL